MSELDAPRAPGSHRRADRSSRLRLLVSLLGVVVVAVGVVAVLKWRGESKKPAPVASSSHTTQPASPSTSGSTASPSQTGTGGTITIVPPTSPSPSPSVSPSPSPSTTTPTPTATASVPVARVALDVLNNTHIVGLAARAAKTFESGGWTVSKTGNYTHTVSVTTVFYPVGEHAVADRLAAEFPKIRRVLPAPPGLSTTHLTVVLARDWS